MRQDNQRINNVAYFQYTSAGSFISQVLFVFISISQVCQAGGYIFAGENNGIDIITHPQGYTGNGGTIEVGVCLDSDAPDIATATQLVIPVRNVINTWNRQQHTTGNLLLGGANELASNELDIESVLLHEVGHCVGLSHVNAASESGLPNPQINATKATDGSDNVFNTTAGTDGIFGSADDIRGDDENLHWCNASNDPFTLLPGAIDGTTYNRDLTNLPSGDLFVVNGDRTVATSFGFPNTEAVMQQGQFFDEAQRELTADGVATVRLAQSGIDEIEGTGDDYEFSLIYRGAFTDPIVEPGCDLNIAMDNVASFAFCSTGGAFIGAAHVGITTANISISSNLAWFFNQVSNDETDLAITKIDAVDPVNVGDDISYTVTVSNIGTNLAETVIMTDTLPSGVTFVSAISSQGSCGEAGGIVTCNLGDLATDDSVSITIIGTASNIGTVTNAAAVSANTFDTNPGNNSATENTTVVSTTDTDSDGIPDVSDNCINTPNGPLIPDAGGNSQLDTDGDNYGNICDADFNQNLIVDPADFSQLKSVLGTTSANEDLNGNGIVDPSDFSRLKAFIGNPPGPSGLAP